MSKSLTAAESKAQLQLRATTLVRGYTWGRFKTLFDNSKDGLEKGIFHDFHELERGLRDFADWMLEPGRLIPKKKYVPNLDSDFDKAELGSMLFQWLVSIGDKKITEVPPFASEIQVADIGFAVCPVPVLWYDCNTIAYYAGAIERGGESAIKPGGVLANLIFDSLSESLRSTVVRIRAEQQVYEFGMSGDKFKFVYGLIRGLLDELVADRLHTLEFPMDNPHFNELIATLRSIFPELFPPEMHERRMFALEEVPKLLEHVHKVTSEHFDRLVKP